jgi:UDP-N-acetylglucosamine transferase subunit ALG13
MSIMEDKRIWRTKYADYQLDKTKKIAYVIAKNRARPDEVVENNCQRIAQAFAEIGWALIDCS